MKKPGFVPFQKKSAGGADPDGIPGNADDNLPPAKGKPPLPAKGKGKKRPAKFAPPWMTSKKGASDNDGDE